jgi:uncharacterized membrane-anchored protein YhcB (DUF1043 family)
MWDWFSFGVGVVVGFIIGFFVLLLLENMMPD